MIVTNELLGYERIKILQDPEMFHFSIDSMLLANFATINRGTKNIVDFCTGNAPIPLYLTLRTESKITAFEIQDKAYKLALDSVNLNNLGGQINVINADVKEAHNYIKRQSINLITCNPPYFKLNPNSNLNKNDYLSIARHELYLTLEQMIKEASILLVDGGYLSIVYTPERLKELFVLLDKYHFNATRLRFVYPYQGRKANHILVEARLGTNKNEQLHILSPLYIYTKKGNWTKEVLKIYNYDRKK